MSVEKIEIIPVKPKIAETFILLFCDRIPKDEERRVLKQKIKGKIYNYDYERFLNRSLNDMKKEIHEEGYKAILFNMKDIKAREWVARNKPMLGNYIKFVLTSCMTHAFISFVNADMVFKWKELNRMEFRITQDLVERIEKIEGPKSLLRRIIIRVLNACFSSFRDEYKKEIK